MRQPTAALGFKSGKNFQSMADLESYQRAFQNSSNFAEDRYQSYCDYLRVIGVTLDVSFFRWYLLSESLRVSY